jgi:hypothetical protein
VPPNPHVWAGFCGAIEDREAAPRLEDPQRVLDAAQAEDREGDHGGKSRNMLRVSMGRCYLRSPVTIKHAATIRAAPAHTATVGTSAKNTNPNSAAYGSAR